MISANLPSAGDKRSGPPALSSVIVRNSLFKTPLGTFEIDRASVLLGLDTFAINTQGHFGGDVMSVSGNIEVADGATSLGDFSVSWGSASVRLNGPVLPEADLACSFSDVDLDASGAILPAIKSSTITGVYSGEFKIGYSDKTGISADGLISSNAGSVWILPFASLKSSLRYSKDRIMLDKISVKLFDANIMGSASVSLLASGPPERHKTCRRFARYLEDVQRLPLDGGL
jgi:hypothetical protein